MERFEKIILRRLSREKIRTKILSQYSTYATQDKKEWMESLERKGYISSRSFFTERSKKEATEYSLTKKGEAWVKENIQPH